LQILFLLLIEWLSAVMAIQDFNIGSHGKMGKIIFTETIDLFEPKLYMNKLLCERESQSAMIICRVCARRFFQFPVMFTNNKKWRSTQRLVSLNQNMTYPAYRVARMAE
jgi:hypothetical protein